jgi:nucleotide-binding universal stress UspA family protein
MFNKILVPLDGSSLAEGILPQVEYVAELTGAEVCLLRVAYVHALPGVDPTELEVKVVEEAETYLQGIADDLEEKGLKTSVHVRYGHVAEEILEQANRADLVAMTTHGRTGLRRWALGSVADRVLNHCPKPVLLCRCGEEGQCCPA